MSEKIWPQTKKELINALRNIEGNDPEEDHILADELLLKYINDPEVDKAFSEIDMWYS